MLPSLPRSIINGQPVVVVHPASPSPPILPLIHLPFPSPFCWRVCACCGWSVAWGCLAGSVAGSSVLVGLPSPFLLPLPPPRFSPPSLPHPYSDSMSTSPSSSSLAQLYLRVAPRLPSSVRRQLRFEEREAQRLSSSSASGAASSPRIKTPHMASWRDRLQTFSGWPHPPSTHPSAQPMSLALEGFFQSEGREARDTVQCFACGATLYNCKQTSKQEETRRGKGKGREEGSE